MSLAEMLAPGGCDFFGLALGEGLELSSGLGDSSGVALGERLGDSLGSGVGDDFFFFFGEGEGELFDFGVGLGVSLLSGAGLGVGLFSFELLFFFGDALGEGSGVAFFFDEGLEGGVGLAFSFGEGLGDGVGVDFFSEGVGEAFLLDAEDLRFFFGGGVGSKMRFSLSPNDCSPRSGTAGKASPPRRSRISVYRLSRAAAHRSRHIV